jgi:hypothetical protein
MPQNNEDAFVSVPETILPNGTHVPAFQVGQYLTGQRDGNLVIAADVPPHVCVSYHTARSLASAASYSLITETQALALAYQIAIQDINWTGGKIGEGKLFQGLRKGTVRSAQPATFEPIDPDERRWFALPGGHKIFDVAGNAYTWIFDNVQGDKNGLIAKAFDPASTSIDIPYPDEEKGQGWIPRGGANWSGRALIRGGCWRSGGGAGVFILLSDWPDLGSGSVGFRCTKPIGL